jgi:hypothetical protein
MTVLPSKGKARSLHNFFAKPPGGLTEFTKKRAKTLVRRPEYLEQYRLLFGQRRD